MYLVAKGKVLDALHEAGNYQWLDKVHCVLAQLLVQPCSTPWVCQIICFKSNSVHALRLTFKR